MEATAHAPRGLVIAAPGTGSGKTTVTLGLLAAFRRRGISVQPFKTGPDYIDTGHHQAAAGRPGFNLDTWAMSPRLIADVIAHAAHDADLAIVEGMMGLFDGAGHPGLSGSGATADLAALTGWPVVLVLDVGGQTETAAALALGCARYRPDIRVAGVILNQVAGDGHLELIRPAFARIGLGIFGALRRQESVRLPERHLGLVQASEAADRSERIESLATLVESAVDLDAILAAAGPAQRTASHRPHGFRAIAPPGQRIALARDEAFSFAYNHILRGWREAGAEIVPFSPLADESPCDGADAVWLPGGYPELHAGRIAAAADFFTGLRALAEKSIPIHGECGGYMVLGQGLEDAEGTRHAMAGLLQAETSFRAPRLHLGYRRATLRSDCSLGRKGTALYGHEFHFATLLSDAGDPLFDGIEAGAPLSAAGSRTGSVTGSFFHLVSAAEDNGAE